MRSLSRFLLLAAVAGLLLSCRTPTYDSAHRDARNSGPFWTFERQDD